MDRLPGALRDPRYARSHDAESRLQLEGRPVGRAKT